MLKNLLASNSDSERILSAARTIRKKSGTGTTMNYCLCKPDREATQPMTYDKRAL